MKEGTGPTVVPSAFGVASVILPATTPTRVEAERPKAPSSEPVLQPKVPLSGTSAAMTQPVAVSDPSQGSGNTIPVHPGLEQNLPKSADLSSAESPASAVPSGAGLGKMVAVPTPSAHPGTIAAECDPVMVTANQWNIIADAAEKKMPGHGMSPSGAPGAGEAGGVENDWAAAGRALTHLPALGFTGLETFDQTDVPAESAPSRTQLLEQVQQLFTEATVHWRLLRTDTWQVVLRPDADTELTLHFQIQNGNVNAVAQCPPGDFSAFNAQWSELQHRMADQGVRLAALEPTAGGLTSFMNGDRQPPSGGHSRSSDAFAVPECSLTAPARRTRSPNRTVRAVLVNGEWECWA